MTVGINMTLLRKILSISVFCLFGVAFFVLTQRELQASGPISFRPLVEVTTSNSEADFGADITTGIQLSFEEGTNQFGKRTFLRGNSIDFGPVSFINPELISNGDSYREGSNLILEGIVNIDVVFNGASSVFLKLSKLRASVTPFHNTYYALTTNRSSSSTKILEDPLKNTLTTTTTPTTLILRLLFEISPQQQGHLNDRFRLEASSL